MDNFIDIEFWRKNIVVPGDEKFGRQDFYEYYREKFRICRLFNPATICEIGVRWGYSAFAFLYACPEAVYTGYDLVGGGHGGVKIDTFGHVRLTLEKHFPDSEIRLVYSDTRELDTLGGPYHFIHVDGNHTEMACFHDLKIALNSLRPGGTILVDDYLYINGVRRATDNFILKNRIRIESFYEVPSLRGEMIIRKKDD